MPDSAAIRSATDRRRPMPPAELLAHTRKMQEKATPGGDLWKLYQRVIDRAAAETAEEKS